ncbi:tetratricopeptide repeat protein 36 [Spea bombifrons]|uniref:tetratricopeptide repeat protein 36 n=1 Tax=Spea bombifrons TaxID=233779 RepID=UPI0023499383|nr:tetratricopeptide repeat protein 36 [Spea bombifrons]
MGTPNDLAVLHAIFNPNAPFWDLEEQNIDNREGHEDSDRKFPPELLEQVQILEKQGVEAAESGDAETALQRFNEAISLLPERASAYNNRAQTLRLKGDIIGALRDLNIAVELSEGQGFVGQQALVQRGLVLRLQGQEEESRKDLQRAAELGSEFAKRLLVQLNPYAALCNRMLRDMIQNLSEPNSQRCQN